MSSKEIRKGRDILNMDEAEAFESLFSHPGYKSLLKIVDQLVIDQEQAVLKLDISSGVDALVYAKMRAEGARKLYNAITQLKSIHTKAK
jgi:hypothetical protein